jgi:hypothetical protein
LLTLLWLLAATALIAAIIAWQRARSVAKRLERLSESYWELKYESGQFKSRLNRLEEASGVREPEAEPSRTGGAGSTAFVPLSSLKK